MKAAGLDRWPVDAPRHTFATALYASTDDAAKVMSQLGHFGNPDTFVRHYKGTALTKKQAAAYWDIRPVQATPSVIPFAKGA